MGKRTKIIETTLTEQEFRMCAQQSLHEINDDTVTFKIEAGGLGLVGPKIYRKFRVKHMGDNTKQLRVSRILFSHSPAGWAFWLSLYFVIIFALIYLIYNITNDNDIYYSIGALVIFIPMIWIFHLVMSKTAWRNAQQEIKELEKQMNRDTIST